MLNHSITFRPKPEGTIIYLLDYAWNEPIDNALVKNYEL